MKSCILLAVVIVAMTMVLSHPCHTESRELTLDRAALAQAFGGDTEQGCCGEIDACQEQMACIDTNPGLDCRLLGREDEKTQANSQGCEYSAVPQHECEEGGGGTTFVSCKKRWRCRTESDGEGGQFCVRDDDYSLVQDTLAPPNCTSNCM